jgi:hypothetical protein
MYYGFVYVNANIEENHLKPNLIVAVSPEVIPAELKLNVALPLFRATLFGVIP